MLIITSYAPSSFLVPCVILSTEILDTGECETVAVFVDALNQNGAIAAFYAPSKHPHTKIEPPRVIKHHKSQGAAELFHLRYARQFHNGGSNDYWWAGGAAYNKLREMYDKSEECTWDRTVNKEEPK